MLSNNYVSKISKLPRINQLLLVLCNVERYRKLVIEFDEFYNEEIYELFTDKLEKAFNLLFNESLDFKYLQESLKKLEESVPDTEDYPETQGSLAQNAMIALCYCYDFILTNHSENVIFALNKSFETIDAIKYEIDSNYDLDNGYEIKVQKENAVLDKFLKILNDSDTITDEIIVKLKDVASKNMFTNSIV